MPVSCVAFEGPVRTEAGAEGGNTAAETEVLEVDVCPYGVALQGERVRVVSPIGLVSARTTTSYS